MDGMTSLAHAERVVLKSAGARVTFDDYAPSVIKFGRNGDIGTSAEMVWSTGGTETLPSTNAIDTITSSDDGDTVDMVVIGHTVAGSVFTRATQTVTLTGQTAATLPTALARVERAYTAGTTATAGTVYVWESGGGSSAGVPTVAADIHLSVRAAVQQSEKCAFTVPGNEWLLIQQVAAGILGTTTGSADVSLQTKAVDGVWRERFVFTARASGVSHVVVPFQSPFLIGPNTDIRVMATASGPSQQIVATVDGSFGLVIG